MADKSGCEEKMIMNCPHCDKQLKLSEKIRESVRQLGAGKKIKVKCVHCAVPFGLDESSMKLVSPGSDSGRPAVSGGALKVKVKPPGPPNIEWLSYGSFDEKETIEDIPEALVLMPMTKSFDPVVQAIMESGYHVDQCPSPEDAIEKMRFVNYAAVILHSAFEPGGIESGKFHQFMQNMSMSRRRYIFYVLIGEEFETLYDLQALANSANLVVNEKEIPVLGTVLKKAIPEFENLFGPLMEELQVLGK